MGCRRWNLTCNVWCVIVHFLTHLQFNFPIWSLHKMLSVAPRPTPPHAVPVEPLYGCGQLATHRQPQHIPIHARAGHSHAAPAHHIHTCSSHTHLLITYTLAHHIHTCSSHTHLLITYTLAHHIHTCSSHTHLLITYTPAHHIHTCSSHTHLLITYTLAHHIHTCSSHTHLLISHHISHALVTSCMHE
jgi:hypothetical protein